MNFTIQENQEVTGMELSERRQRILAAIVEQFIASGEPVGSKALCNLFELSISSATIRNEMVALAELGLIEQPHTSAGRVPSHLVLCGSFDELPGARREAAPCAGGEHDCPLRRSGADFGAGGRAAC